MRLRLSWGSETDPNQSQAWARVMAWGWVHLARRKVPEGLNLFSMFKWPAAPP